VDFYAFDAEYVRRLRAREEDVQEHFSLYFAERLRMKLRVARCPAADIDDAIQETLLRVLERLDELRDPHCLGAFVHGFCTNIHREDIRKKKKFDPLPKDYSEILRSRDNQEEDFLEAERKKAVWSVIQKMRPKDRDLLVAVFLKEEPREEICKKFGVTPGYLRVCVCRLKKALKRRFLKKFDDEHPPEPEND
jgi:RNA polymerase sigma factor (sigma-70 family)